MSIVQSTKKKKNYKTGTEKIYIFHLLSIFINSDHNGVKPVGHRTDHSLMKLIWLVTQFWAHV